MYQINERFKAKYAKNPNFSGPISKSKETPRALARMGACVNIRGLIDNH